MVLGHLLRHDDRDLSRRGIVRGIARRGRRDRRSRKRRRRKRSSRCNRWRSDRWRRNRSSRRARRRNRRAHIMSAAYAESLIACQLCATFSAECHILLFSSACSRMLLWTGAVPGFRCLPRRRSSWNLLFVHCLPRIVRLVDASWKNLICIYGRKGSDSAPWVPRSPLVGIDS